QHGVFHNLVETNMDIGFQGFLKMFSERFFGDTDKQTPEGEIPVQAIDTTGFAAVQDTATVLTWLGHSAFMVEIDGKRLLLDPMMGDIASPISFLGPR